MLYYTFISFLNSKVFIIKCNCLEKRRGEIVITPAISGEIKDISMPKKQVAKSPKDMQFLLDSAGNLLPLREVDLYERETPFPETLEKVVASLKSKEFILSMPEIARYLERQVKMGLPFTRIQENLTSTEIYVIGEDVMVVHGGGVFHTRAKMHIPYSGAGIRVSEHDIEFAYKQITVDERSLLFKGELLDGTKFPIFDIEAYRKETRDFPRIHAVRLSYELAMRTRVGRVEFDYWRGYPGMFVAKVGGLPAAEKYLDAMESILRHDTKSVYPLDNTGLPSRETLGVLGRDVGTILTHVSGQHAFKNNWFSGNPGLTALVAYGPNKKHRIF